MKIGWLSAFQAANRHSGSHFEGMEADRLGPESNIDVELPAVGNQGVQRSGGVTDVSNRYVLGTGRHLEQQVPARGIGGRGPVEIRQGHYGPGERLPGLFIPHDARHRRLPGLQGKEDVGCCEEEAHRTPRDPTQPAPP
jgi:hypothetical protein